MDQHRVPSMLKSWVFWTAILGMGVAIFCLGVAGRWEVYNTSDVYDDEIRNAIMAGIIVMGIGALGVIVCLATEVAPSVKSRWPNLQWPVRSFIRAELPKGEAEAEQGLQFYEFVDQHWDSFLECGIRTTSYSESGLIQAAPYADIEVSVRPLIPLTLRLEEIEADGSLGGLRLPHIHSTRAGGIYGADLYTLNVTVDIPKECADLIRQAAGQSPPSTVTWDLKARITLQVLGSRRTAKNIYLTHDSRPIIVRQ